MNAPVTVDIAGETDPLKIAQKELRERKIPMVRDLTNNPPLKLPILPRKKCIDMPLFTCNNYSMYP